jgi:hypothetical protein
MAVDAFAYHVMASIRADIVRQGNARPTKEELGVKKPQS